MKISKPAQIAKSHSTLYVNKSISQLEGLYHPIYNIADYVL